MRDLLFSFSSKNQRALLRLSLNEIGLSFLARFSSYYFVFAKDLDCGVGTDDGTDGAARTIGVGSLCREIANFIRLLGNNDAILRAYYYTQAAAFAPFDINNYFASHFSYCVYRMAYCVQRIMLNNIKLPNFSKAECFCKDKR